MEQRFFEAIWLGRDTATGETLLGGNKVVTVGARTVRRMPKPDKYDKQMFDIISRTYHDTDGPAMVFHSAR